MLRPPAAGDDWLALTSEPLDIGATYDWAVRENCGAVVVFTGTVRDHAEGRDGVTALEYEAYEEQVVPKFAEIAAEVRARWPGVGRLALLHRVGELHLTEATVVVAVSAPHRDEAFVAARHAIDTLKAAAPIWKRETWAGGEDWATGATEITPVTP
jgi:molybdopterin synthase catalytic subunit